MLEMKRKAEQLKIFLEKTQNKVGRTKRSTEMIKALDKFIRCNLKDKAIFKKYEKVRNLVNEVKG
jgi:hypothetical protein